MKLGQGKKAWAGRTARGVAVMLLLLVLGACEQLASAPETDAVQKLPAGVTVTKAPETDLSAQLTGVWGTVPMWAYSYGSAKIDSTWQTGGKGQIYLENRSSNTYSFVQFRSGTQPWVATPAYLAPGRSALYYWSYSGAPVSYSFRTCRYLSGGNTCGSVITIRPG